MATDLPEILDCIFFKEIDWTESIYILYKDTLHNFSFNQFE
jgi:malonyl CoA-acyl carrier protein transacylase